VAASCATSHVNSESQPDALGTSPVSPFSYAEQISFVVFMGHPESHLQGRRVTYEGPYVESNIAFAGVFGVLSIYFVARSTLRSSAEYLSN
jgi:hypothetical protein